MFPQTKEFGGILLTGDINQSVKQKNSRGIKGKVLLELYSAETKEKIKEAYTENLIPDLYFRDTFLTHFVQGIMGAGGQRYTINRAESKFEVTD